MSLNKEVGLDDVMQIIAEKLEAGGSVTFNPKGTSMLPMLRDGDDTVVLSKPKGADFIFLICLYTGEKTVRMYCTVSSISEVTAVILCAVTISLPLKKVLPMMM